MYASEMATERSFDIQREVERVREQRETRQGRRQAAQRSAARTLIGVVLWSFRH